MAGPDTGQTSGAQLVPVCAIGASAGGVTALQKLFGLLPDDLGFAYVVVVHLPPDQPSSLHEILSACTRMPVQQTEGRQRLRADTIQVIAPDRELVIEGDAITARSFTESPGRRAPIDMLFSSVAASRNDGVAVVLTGAGHDGTAGIRAIKEAGGIVMVQEPAEAGFPSMPQNAIATGLADIVAPLSELAERIAEAARTKNALGSLDEEGQSNGLRRIVAFLRTRTGHDFGGYKRSTVGRRVSRRMQVCRIETLGDYARHLYSTPEEAKALFADLLISVTMFFRDPAAFEALRVKVVRPLLEAALATADEEFRMWVVGCATGEEAYSLAILLIEEAERLKTHAPMQIFASDLDEGALAAAREGRYPRSIEADVSVERLRRFFVDEGTHYRVNRRMRDLVLFATHSVVREPPFTRLDLITCRNVLIYLERPLQQRVCSIFHYALKPDRYLFLGSAETADTVQDQFGVLDRDARIYTARSSSPAHPPVLPTPSLRVFPPAPGQEHAPSPRFEPAEVLGVTHAAALEASAPPSALVDADQILLHLSPTLGRFISLSGGPRSDRLPNMVRPELRLDLKMALDRASETGRPAGTRFIDVDFDADVRRVSAYVTPVPVSEGAGSRAIVHFLDYGPSRKGADAGETLPSDELRHLHLELKAAQEAALAGRIGQEGAVQELRASNEELQSLNEEYRSTAEELETSKEELQSINEELQTVNAELKAKLSIISLAHNDLKNLTASSEIGTLFLDVDLRIRMFTPPVADLISLTNADVGRLITDFAHRLADDGIADDARKVIQGLEPIERDVRAIGDRWYTLRVRPYRTLEGAIEGVVVTFDDMTVRRRGEEALRDSEARFRTIFEAVDQGFYFAEALFDASGRCVDILYHDENAAAVRILGQSARGRRLSDLGTYEQYWRDIFGRVARTGRGEHHERFAAESGIWYDFYAFKPSQAAENELAIVFSDITERRRAEDALRQSEERYRALAEHAPSLLWQSDPEARTFTVNQQWAQYTGRPERDIPADGWLSAGHPDERDATAAALSRAVAAGDLLEREMRLRDGAGQYRRFLVRHRPERDGGGQVVRWFGAAIALHDDRERV